MGISDDIVLGTKVFKRTEKLENLFESIDNSPISKVIVADDGNTEEREELYEKNYNFDLSVIDLEFDSGLGKGRRRIVNKMDRKYLLIVDSDHLIPNIKPLYNILENDKTVGGVSGLILEKGKLLGKCNDIFLEDNYIVNDIREQKSGEDINSNLFIEFDFVPNAALFRKETLEDYCWDSEFVIGGEHLDFYIGHLETKWRFGVCPEVIFPHFPGGSNEYMKHRGNPFKVEKSHEYLLSKWGKNQIINNESWLDRSQQNKTIAGRIVKVLPTLKSKSLFIQLNRKIWKLKHFVFR